LNSMSVDMIVLAGFLLMVPAFIIRAYSGRIINIHPALLPGFGGKGMFGSNVHRAVVDAGETETGITIHHVSEKYDEGRIIFQAKVPLSPTDTPAQVEEKVHILERLHFPRVIAEML
ncbi:MAG: phosphoribosylglycinamide formyltransferase, partial [Muribaculaceae bacterium]|nr:phosphoribosylglycinamide formyltransferase [Muribaculaceae bacterium]